MEMRIKLADLAAREALLDMEETESILEKKCESKPFFDSHKIVATHCAQPIAAKYPPVSKKSVVVNTSNWESRVSFSLPQYPTASTVPSVPGPLEIPIDTMEILPLFPHSSLFISLCNSQPSFMFSFGLSARFQWGFSWAFIDFWITSNICTVAILSINPLQLLFTNFSRLLSSTDDHILTNYSFSLGCSGLGTRGNGVSTPFHVLL